jgi:hypothetical protein
MNTFYIWRICISSWWSGWSSKFFGLLSISVVVIEPWAVEALSFACYYCLCKQLLCAFLSLIFLCGMMLFFVVGVLPTLEMCLYLSILVPLD